MFSLAFDSVLLGAADSVSMVDKVIQWGVIIALVVVPVLIGKVVGKAIRMPTHGTRIGYILIGVAFAAYALFPRIDANGNRRIPLKYGVDLNGGTILVYELEQGETPVADPNDPTAPPAAVLQQARAKQLIGALTERLNPSGTNEIVIRPYGENQIEIIVPNTEQSEVEVVKRKISMAGILRFAIVANMRDHRALIEQAREMATSEKEGERRRSEIRDSDNRLIGVWSVVDREDAALNPEQPLRVEVSGDIIRSGTTKELINTQGQDLATYMRERGVESVEVLMAINPDFDITGEELSVVRSSTDEYGAPAVSFGLRDLSSDRFYALTSQNAPVGDFYRRLGIVLDGRLMSAPRINSAISSSGIISGKFTRAEVDFLVSILQSGSLPAALVKTPVAENQIASTLGADTIRKSSYAMVVASLLVVVFMVGYYWMPGIIACVALALNVLFILATMVLFKAPLTLPGMAGLVLTIGMSVDANVLIFERIREERDRGSGMRLAIRNGFSRAMTTIIDSNLTTIITAIVLYAIGTDQIRGFAVTLILGILSSMVTAIYVARTIFDIGEKQGWLSLSMSNGAVRLRDMIGGKAGMDFMKIKVPAIVFSLVLIGIGLVATYMRGMSILDTDFLGGTNIVFQLREPREADKVREIVTNALNPADATESVDVVLTNIFVQGSEPGTVFKLDTSLDNIDALKEILFKALVDDGGKSLLTSYEAEIQKGPANDPATTPAVAPPAADGATPPPAASSRIERKQPEIRQVSFRPQDTAADGTAPPATPEAKPAESTDSPAATTPAGEPPATTPPSTETPAATPPATDTPAASPTADSAPATAATPATEAAAAAPPAETPPSKVVSTASLKLSIQGSDRPAAIAAEALKSELIQAAKNKGVTVGEMDIHLQPQGKGAEDWNPESSLRFDQWLVTLDLPAEPADQVMAGLIEHLHSTPALLSSSKIGGRVADGMKSQAIIASLVSVLFLIVYIWFRFHRFVYGLAAIMALIHDVLVTIGFLAASYWLAQAFGFLLIDPFKISLSVVAALLTLVGYSLNDTIVTFDRIREIKGKSPVLTAGMINDSINQTLSRTILTFFTTFIVVVVLYVMGGESIHAFAFSLLIGLIAGTYSSIFIAAPILIWMGEGTPERRHVPQRPATP